MRPQRWQPTRLPLPGILQARTLEWVAISFSNAWKWKVKVKSLSRVRLLVTPWTVAYQAPPYMGFSRQEYGSGCHCLLLWVTTSQQLSQLYQPAATENVIRFASKSPLIPDLHAFPNTPKRYYQPSLLKTDVPDQLSPLPIVGNNLTFVFHFRYWVVVSSLVDRSNHENKTDLGISNKDKKI